MKKFFLFFVIFMFFGVLSAQEAQNEPVSEQNEQISEQNDPVAVAEEVKEVTEAAPAPAPAAENQENEAQAAPQEEEKTPETTEKPAAPEPEETKKETPAPAETAKEEAVQPETAAKSACECYNAIKDNKPSKMFYQPSVGLGLGASIFSMRINNDFDFLLKHTQGGTNVYMGLEIDFRYSPYLDEHAVYEIPFQLNFLFDFPVRHRTIKRLALWFSAGVDLAIGYLWYYDYDEDWDDKKDRDAIFKVMPAWGFGVNMLFHNDVTLKLGFDSFYGKYPDIICAAGYRF